MRSVIKAILVLSFFIPSDQNNRLPLGIERERKSPKAIEPKTKLLHVWEGGIVQRIDIRPSQAGTKLFQQFEA